MSTLVVRCTSKKNQWLDESPHTLNLKNTLFTWFCECSNYIVFNFLSTSTLGQRLECINITRTLQALKSVCSSPPHREKCGSNVPS